MIITTSNYSAYHKIIKLALHRYAAHYQKLNERIEKFIPGNTRVNIHRARFEKYSYILDETRIIIVLLSHSLMEALANFYLALRSNEEVFKLLEYASVIDKWTVVPCLFIPGYKLPKSEQIYNDLNLLVKMRNAFTHVKPKVVHDGRIIHKGNFPNHLPDDYQFTMNCVSLPLRLLKNLRKFDKTDAFRDLVISSGYDISEF